MVRSAWAGRCGVALAAAGWFEKPLNVRVVDADEQPVIGAEVALVIDRALLVGRTLAPEMARRDEHLNRWLTVARTTAPDGTATFDVEPLEGLLEEHEFLGTVARLVVPTLDPVQAKVDLRFPEPGPLLLLRPEVGAVRLDLAGIVDGEVRLRALAKGEPTDRRHWNVASLAAVAVAAGGARFPCVPLDGEFAYELRTRDGLPPLTGRFHGPRRAGEELPFAVPDLATGPIVHGRLLDECGRPLRRHAVDVLIDAAAGESAETRGRVITTDAKGRFVVALPAPVAAPPAKGAKRRLRLVAEAPARDGGVLVAQSVEIELLKAPSAGPHDAGDVTLVEPGGPRWLEQQSDDELQREHERRRAAVDRTPLATEACLLEMARRKSERWKKLLAAEWKKRQPGAPEELAALTALRRATGKPDPLALELLEAGPLTTTYPETPTVRFRLKNVDGAKESFTLTRAGDYRSGRFARIRVVARDLEGREVAVRTRFGLADGGVAERAVLAPGHSWTEEALLADFVEFTVPGEYEVRLAYHDRVAVADLDRVDGYALTWSAPFRVRLAPPPLVVARARVDELKGEFAAIDPAKPAPLVAMPWRADLEYDGAASSPADRLFRAGVEAVPALLELLEDKKQSVAARGLALAYLWNVTGMHEPTAGSQRAVVCSVRWHCHWPGVVADTPPEWEAPVVPDRPVAAADQTAVIDRWRAMRAWWSITVETP